MHDHARFDPVDAKSFERERTRGSSSSEAPSTQWTRRSLDSWRFEGERSRGFSRAGSSRKLRRPSGLAEASSFVESGRLESEICLFLCFFDVLTIREFTYEVGSNVLIVREFTLELEVWRPQKPGSSRGLAFTRGSWLRSELFELQSRQALIANFSYR